jgi:hypothetical protein
MVGGRHAMRAVRACVQAPEPRRLFAAAVPVLTGAPYVGTVGSVANPAAGAVEIQVTSEKKSGNLAGTLTQQSIVRIFTGTVNSHGKLVLHVKQKVTSVHPHFVIHPETLTGTVSADGNTISGQTNSGGFRGVFSVTRVAI